MGWIFPYPVDPVGEDTTPRWYSLFPDFGVSVVFDPKSHIHVVSRHTAIDTRPVARYDQVGKGIFHIGSSLFYPYFFWQRAATFALCCREEEWRVVYSTI
jgi:hypothetical protein